MTQSLSRQSIFSSLEKLYASEDKTTLKSLSGVIPVMLRNTSNRCNFVEMLMRFNLFRSYVMNIGGNSNQNRRALLDLKFHLSRIATISEISNQYESLVKVMAETDVQRFITNLIDQN
jgi:hypothetical protein